MPAAMLTYIDRYRMYWDTVLQQNFMVLKTGKKYEKFIFLAKKRHCSEF